MIMPYLELHLYPLPFMVMVAQSGQLTYGGTPRKLLLSLPLPLVELELG